jgi:hypothetical protein
MKYIKEFQLMKGPLKVDNLITNMVDWFKMWAILFFVKNNIGVQNKDPRMYA